MSVAQVLSHLSFMLLAFLVLPVAPLRCAGRAMLLLLTGALSFVQVSGLSLGDYTRSFADDLSIVGMVWLLCLGLGRVLNRQLIPGRHQRQLVLLVVLLGVVLYPATLGLSADDPYRLGFAPRVLMIFLFATCLLWWWLGNYFALTLVTFATGFYLLDIKASDNYWDYLMDPLLWVICCVYTVGSSLQYCWRKLSGIAIHIPASEGRVGSQ